MRSMNCRRVRNEIDEASPGDSLSLVASDHLKNCADCESFSREHLKLREIVSSLGTVEAPGDFEVRVRARLASQRHGGDQRFVIGNIFSVRWAALATILLMIGSALLFASLRTQPDNSLSASNATSPSNAINVTLNHDNGKQTAAPAIAAPDALASTDVVTPDVRPTAIVHRDNKSRGRARSTELASARDNGRIRARDLSSTGAEAVKQADEIVGSYPTFAIPVAASYQSLTVSLDNGRGTSRTISLPTVSFGSQRFLSQSQSPLLASARESW